MTTYSDNQYVAVGFPKGGLTPATITAMVGFSQGEGLQMNPAVGQAVSALSGIANTSPLYGSAQALSSRLSTLSSKIMAGGPAAFMQKLNTARGHIADSIELKKVTAFTANQSLDSFGTGMKKMSSLSSNGLDGALGNMAAAGAAMAAAGPLFDLSDVKNLGSPVGLIKKLTSSKMANATGVNAELAKAGIDVADLENPAYADKISKVMNNIKDPKVLKDVADQFGVNPPGGLPEVGKQSFAALAASNPFAGTPGYTGTDSSLSTNAGATLLGGAPSAPIEPPPQPIPPSPVEASATPRKWANINDLSNNAPPISAVVSRTETVTDFEGNSWQVFGSVNTKTRLVTFIIYGSEGQSVVEGSSSKVIGLLQQLPKGEDNFVDNVINSVRTMESSLRSLT
jgi:hypothetical protein